MNHTSCILPWEKKEQSCQANYWVIYLFAVLGGSLYLHKSQVRIRFVTVPSGDIFVYIKISALAVHREQTSVLHPGCVWYPELTRIVQCLFICSVFHLCFWMHGLRFSFWLEWRGWHLAGSASCARFSDGRVHRADNKPARGAETRRKMSNARSGGMTERWPLELTVSAAFFVRAKHRGLCLKVILAAFPGYLSEKETGMDPGPASSWAGLNFFLNFLPF